MTNPTSPDLLDLAEAVANGKLRADDAERQVRAALGPVGDGASDRAIHKLRGLMVGAGAVRAHVHATRKAVAVQGAEATSATATIETIVPGPVRAGAAHHRPSPARDARGPRRTWLLVAATIAVGAGVVGASLVGGRLVTPRPAPSTSVAVASPTAAPSEPLPASSPSPSAVAASRPGGLIAYIRTTEKPNPDNCGVDPMPTCRVPRLWIVGSDGSGAHELFADGVSSQGGLMWSPDGSRLLYTDADKYYLTDANGREPQLVDTGCVAPCYGDLQAAFSSDGTHLVFVRNSLTTATSSSRRWTSPAAGSRS